MRIIAIALAVALVGIIIAIVYEVKFTYRDGGLWKNK